MLLNCVMTAIILTNHFLVVLVLTLLKGIYYKGLYNLFYLIIIRLLDIDYCCTRIFLVFKFFGCTQPWNRKISGFLVIKSFEENPLVLCDRTLSSTWISIGKYFIFQNSMLEQKNLTYKQIYLCTTINNFYILHVWFHCNVCELYHI